MRIAVELHGVREVLLLNHEDCGAYGGAQAFPDEASERDRHQSDLRGARDEILRVFPRIRVRLFVIGFEGESGQEPTLSFTEVSG